jgi:hypothetical protein
VKKFPSKLRMEIELNADNKHWEITIIDEMGDIICWHSSDLELSKLLEKVPVIITCALSTVK